MKLFEKEKNVLMSELQQVAIIVFRATYCHHWIEQKQISISPYERQPYGWTFISLFHYTMKAWHFHDDPQLTYTVSKAAL